MTFRSDEMTDIYVILISISTKLINDLHGPHFAQLFVYVSKEFCIRSISHEFGYVLRYCVKMHMLVWLVISHKNKCKLNVS